MKRSFLFYFLFLIPYFSFTQQVVDLEENKPYEFNGLQYGFYVSNERSKEVKGDDYERYELNLYVTNNSGCIKIIPFRSNSYNSSSNDEVIMAEFNCKNATGKRLTAKGGKVNARPWYTQVKVEDYTPDSSKKSSSSSTTKYKMVNAQVGYAIKNGETITSRIVVIVPKDERPKVTVRTVYFPEM